MLQFLKIRLFCECSEFSLCFDAQHLQKNRIPYTFLGKEARLYKKNV